MSIFNGISTSTEQSISFDPDAHPLGNLLRVATNQKLSVEARLLYVILVLMAWSKGKCWPSQTYQAQSLGRSDRQVRRYHQELEKAGILGINRRPGQSSHYYPFALQTTSDTHDLRAQDTHVRQTLKSELLNVKNVEPTDEPGTSNKPLSPDPDPIQENVNAIQNFSESIQEPPRQPQVTPPNPTVETPASKANLTPDQWCLLEDIEQACQDFHSRWHFINLIRQHDETTIYAALSVTKEKMSLESGVRGGAYFTATLKGMARLQGLGSTPEQSIPPSSCSEPYRPQRVQILESEPEPVDPEGLVKGLRFQWKAGGLQSLLSCSDKCASGVDTLALWGQVRGLLPDEQEETLVDRFLDTLKVRMKHQPEALT
jgi:hypothetical protein